MTSAILAWAIKAPDGKIDTNYIGSDPDDLTADYQHGLPFCWATLEHEGYRCVRVRVEEIKE
jgi:hypothetical protein